MNQAIIPTIVVVLVIYFAAMVFIGWMGRSKASNFEGYLSMGRTGGVLLLIGSPQESRDGEIDLTAAGGAGQVGQGQAGEQVTGSGPVVLRGAAAAAAIPVVTTHDEVPPIKIVTGLCPPQPSIRRLGTGGTEKEKSETTEVVSLWQREKDSNPHIQSQSLLCYPYTIPLFDCRARKRRCYYSKTKKNVNRKNEKN